MTQEVLKLSQEALAGLKDVENQVRELVAENKALKEALAQEQEPVGYVIVKDHGKVNILDFDFDLDVAEQLSEGKYPAYATQPQRQWVGLTDEEIAQGWKESWVTEQAFQSAVWWAEAKLKEKNT